MMHGEWNLENVERNLENNELVIPKYQYLLPEEKLKKGFRGTKVLIQHQTKTNLTVKA